MNTALWTTFLKKSMNRNETIREFSSLLSEVKEQITYLSELGVEKIEADIPDLKSLTTDKGDGGNTEIPQEMLKKFVPKQDFKKRGKVSGGDESVKKAKRKRSDIFDSVSLSRLSAPTEPQTEPLQVIPAKTSQPEMTKETKTQSSLYGDISETLSASDETLELIRDDIGKECDRCRLCEKRTRVVNSVGNPKADLMFIGEAPGADEDEQGEPFVGRAGKLLTKIIEAIDLSREEVFIGNVNRCRPPGNRRPQADEAEVCKPFLLREIAVVRPKVIVVLGNTACQNLLDTKVGITKLRGSFKDYFGVKVMPTFHPAYLLRDPRKKREVWDDMKTVRDYLDQI